MSKVSIDREELVKLREFMQGATLYSPDWKTAMSMLNAMIGKGEEAPTSSVFTCTVCGQPLTGENRDRYFNRCLDCAAKTAKATPPAPQSVCKGCHFDGGDCYSQKKLGGWVNSCAMRVPATPPAPEYVARQEMEAAIKAALAERMEVHMQTTQHLWRSDVKREAECAVAKAMKAHEAEGHGVGQPSHDDCAHFIVCGLPKPCAGACGFYQKPLKS